MRRFIFSIILFVLSVLCFGSISHAAYQAPNGNTYTYKYDVHNYGRSYDFTLYSNYPCGIYTSTQGLQNQYRCCIQKDQGLYTIDTVSDVPSVSRTLVYGTSDSGSGTFNSSDVCVYMGSSAPSGGMPIYANTSEVVINSNSYATLFQLLKDSVIDFNNVIYDPLIPTPEFDVFYVENSTNATQFFPVVFSLNNNGNEYFVQVYMENLTPSSLGIDVQGYHPYRFYQFPSHDIVSMESLTLAAELNNGVLNGIFSGAWRSDILDYDVSNVDVTPATAAWSESNPNFILLKYEWENMLRNIACFYGNNTGVSFRYFTVRDGIVYGGKVRSWTSLYGGAFSESIPDYYVPGNPAQGYETDTTTDIVPVETANPSVSFPANQYGKKTGLNININLGSNVPNYPDYPTIATYNTDNLLVNAIDTARQLPTFFQNVSGLFGDIFTGILPEEFWNIVLTGFLFSIVIMIIKVL